MISCRRPSSGKRTYSSYVSFTQGDFSGSWETDISGTTSTDSDFFGETQICYSCADWFTIWNPASSKAEIARSDGINGACRVASDERSDLITAVFISTRPEPPWLLMSRLLPRLRGGSLRNGVARVSWQKAGFCSICHLIYYNPLPVCRQDDGAE